MTQKRFSLNKDTEWWFVQDNAIQVNKYGYRDDLTGEDEYRGLCQELTEQETVDLLNELHEENQVLEEQYADDCNEANSMTVKISELTEENEQLKRSVQYWYAEHKRIVNNYVDKIKEVEKENEQLKQENKKLQGKYDHLLWLHNGLGCEYDWLKDENEQLKQYKQSVNDVLKSWSQKNLTAKQLQVVLAIMEELNVIGDVE